MTIAEFDHYAEKYNDALSDQLEFFSKEHHYFAEYKVLVLKKLLESDPNSILDFGCGIGRSTFFLTQHFPNAKIYGCDLSEKSLAIAKKHIPSAHFFNSEDMQQHTTKFNIIFISCVFHHIPPALRLSTLQSVLSACAPRARIVIFEHNPRNVVTRYLAKRCPFDQNAILLNSRELKQLLVTVGVKNIHCRYTLFFPPKWRWLNSIEYYLRFIPWGGQYMISGQV